MGYSIIYTWRGERHRHSRTFDTIEAARQELALFQRDGWRAWIEQN